MDDDKLGLQPRSKRAAEEPAYAEAARDAGSDARARSCTVNSVSVLSALRVIHASTRVRALFRSNLMTSITASPTAGLKRAYQAEDLASALPGHDTIHSSSPPHSTASATSAFRNVSACNRCRIRKNRCDQRLPACTTCEKAHQRCVGYDPITKREIPRSYVFFLETRLAYFESLLKQNDIPYDSADVFDADSRRLGDTPVDPSITQPGGHPRSPAAVSPQTSKSGDWEKRQEDKDKIDKLVSNIGMVSVQGTSDPRYLGSTSGISFARVVLAAVKSSVSTNNSERAGPRSVRPPPIVAAAGGSSMRDSYFGLQTKPSIKEAPFPDRHLGDKLLHLYFEYANPQIPVLHRGEFMDLVDHAYSVEPSRRTSRELYLLNIVFAIGAGIIWGSSDPAPEASEYAAKRPRLTHQQAQPEEYHASAIVHLGAFLSSSSGDASERPGGDLEELQAVLLLAAFALLRPVAPGLWYIVGVAMRLAVDLGLHYEDGTGLETSNVDEPGPGPAARSSGGARAIDAREMGRREWMRDLRRRLWWCTYNFDRLVSTCVGRPFGITDQVVTTEFPSLLDDQYITRTGFLDAPPNAPTYKRVAHHYFRLRLLQSEILQVLQHQQAQQARLSGTNRDNQFIHTDLPSPFLSRYESFRSWRANIDQRLYEWKESAPQQEETGVGFDRKFLELNYWQAVTMLYRQSLSVPGPLAGELSPTEEVSSPSSTMVEEKDDEDLVFLKCAEAGQKTLKLYRQIHRQRLVNYTYLATHHLFMAGISFLYAVWHSPTVRSRLSLDDFDFTVLAATSVLGDLMEKCPPAEACRDAFERMSKATVQMCLSTPGFGFSREREVETPRPPKRESSISEAMALDPQPRQEYAPIAPKPKKMKRPPPQFDMDLRGLFPEDLDSNVRPSASFPISYQRRAQPVPPTFNSHAGTGLGGTPSVSPASNLNSQINTGLGMGQTSIPTFNAAQQPQAQSFAPSSYGSDFMDLSMLPGMDFLNLANTANTSASTAAGNEDFGYDFNSGLDIGFGVGNIGLDFQHDWSDGQQFDLFDGFFFGNNAMPGGNGGS